MIIMSTYICFKCNHQWFKRGDIPPRRCPNHSCRTLKWGRPEEPIQKKIAEASPIDKQSEIADLRQLLAPMEKPKPKEILPVWPVKVEDQPDIYSEPTINYD